VFKKFFLFINKDGREMEYGCRGEYNTYHEAPAPKKRYLGVISQLPKKITISPKSYAGGKIYESFVEF